MGIIHDFMTFIRFPIKLGLAINHELDFPNQLIIIYNRSLVSSLLLRYYNGRYWQIESDCSVYSVLTVWNLGSIIEVLCCEMLPICLPGRISWLMLADSATGFGSSLNVGQRGNLSHGWGRQRGVEMRDEETEIGPVN